jgi:hypothetical protein
LREKPAKFAALADRISEFATVVLTGAESDRNLVERIIEKTSSRPPKTYLAALDVHRVKIFGRCEARNGILPFDRLVDNVMRRSPIVMQDECFGSLTMGPLTEVSPA